MTPPIPLDPPPTREEKLSFYGRAYFLKELDDASETLRDKQMAAYARALAEFLPKPSEQPMTQAENLHYLARNELDKAEAWLWEIQRHAVQSFCESRFNSWAEIEGLYEDRLEAINAARTRVKQAKLALAQLERDESL